MPDNSYSDETWTGIDAWHSPGKMPPGTLQDAQNLLVKGSDLVSRPGLLGLLSALHASPVYILGGFRRADLTTAILYTSGGKLYRLDKGASASAEVTDAFGASLSLVSANAMGARLGQYFYIVDGSGPLVRTDLAHAAALPFLSAPTAAPALSLTSMMIDPLASSTGWSSDTLTGSGQVNRLPNFNFSSTTGSLPTGYSGFGADPDEGGSPPAGYTGNWVNQDTPGEGFYNTTALLNDPIAADSSRYASQFYAAIDAVQLDHTSKSTLIIRVFAYADSGGTTFLGAQSREFTVPYSGGQKTNVGGVFSFASYTAPVLSYRVRFEAGAYNTLGSGTAIYVQNAVCFPFVPAIGLLNLSGQEQVTQATYLSYTGGSQSISNAGEVGAGVGAGGVHLTKDFGAGSPQDWSKQSHVVLSLGKAAGIKNLNLQLAFRDNGSATRTYTNLFTISADGTIATCDISTVPAANRSAFRYLEVVLGGDFTVPVTNGIELLRFGPLTGAGNLSIGEADYIYYAVEVDASPDPAALVDVRQSNPSPGSGPLTPTITQAEGVAALAAPVNAATTYLALYRLGGSVTDTARLIAAVPVGSDVAFGADARNPYYGWNHTARLLTDNTPDSYILQPGSFPVSGTPMVRGRDAPPVGAQAICACNGRLMLGAGSTLWVSWLLTPGSPSSLYFTTAQIPGDPLAAIKGFTSPVGAAGDNDPILALVPHNRGQAYFGLSQTSVVIEKTQGKSLLEGNSGDTYIISDYLKGAGFGAIARRAACLMDNQEVSLCASSVFAFTGTQPVRIGLYVENLIRPRGFDGSAQVTPQALAGAAMVYHDHRLLLSVPDPGQTHNTRTYVYDTRISEMTRDYHHGWTRWNQGFTSACTLSTDTDSDDLYLGGADGQVYILSGSQDQAAPAASPLPIPLMLASRGYGQGSEQQFWREDTVQRGYVLAAMPSGAQGTITVASDRVNASMTAGPFTFSMPYQEFPTGVNGVTGHYLTARLSVSVSGPARIFGLRLVTTDRGPNT